MTKGMYNDSPAELEGHVAAVEVCDLRSPISKPSSENVSRVEQRAVLLLRGFLDL